MRHGQTELNRKGKIQGNNNSHLNMTGNSQSKALASKVQLENPKALYTSPITRAVETAEIIGSQVDLIPQSLIGLSEHNVGLLEGLSSKEMRKKYPDFAMHWDLDPQNAIPPEGNSLGEIQEFAWNTILKLNTKHQNESVLAVSHNFTILCLVAKVLDLPLINYRNFMVSLCSISRLVLDSSGNAKLVSLNETGHLF
tara:strand:- start:91 stop:681 length:591 start_codon:yes stop_codon:yes gene_type:complete